MEIRENESYLRRLTALQACAMMATEMDSDTARLEILPLVLEMATDAVSRISFVLKLDRGVPVSYAFPLRFYQVPNIRFNVAKELQSITPVCGVAAYDSQVLPVLTMLMDDDDRDVRYFAEKAANALDDEFTSVA